MVAYSVDAETLRSTADKMQGVRDGATKADDPEGGDWGNAALAQATSALTAKMNETWAARTEELDEIVSRLRSTADLYERADRESVPQVTEAD
ncbi:hypothetical protein [Microbacterium sp. P05]|uniref:hypothetical protein n=1 Tax=Microbacterium sp. P05 TaxID=3366948 RepID=UPI0037473904